MEGNTHTKQAHPLLRHLSNLKRGSRLLGHELHTQGSSKTVTLSREEVVEIQTTLDLFIEEMSRRQNGMTSAGGGAGEPTRMVSVRN